LIVLTVERLHAVFGVRASIVTDPADGARLFRFHALQ
jgi:iron complex transport system ATP-binding protein